MPEQFEEYKLRCNVIGHKKDVRSLYVVPNNAGTQPSTLLSGSRDCSMKIWQSSAHSNEFHENATLKPTSQFVSAVCYVPASDIYPNGYLIAGNKDGSVIAYSVDGGQQMFKLDHHTDNVCTLDASACGAIISGSWDKSACTYLNETLIFKLQGHEAAVWSVKIVKEQGVALTASADKTIKVWKDGQCIKTLTGHSDCVRSMTLLDGTEFLSCSNDTTVRKWNLVSGECLKVFYGHSNYVYSVCRIRSSNLFASCGEDRNVKIWSSVEDGEALKQTIVLPTQSIWTIDSLYNGDIVIGSSDSMIRVFTSEAKRTASEQDLKAFDQAVLHCQISCPSTDLDVGKLADISVGLLKPGTKEGDVQMVKDNGKPIAYQWTNDNWVKIGNIVGTNKNKTMHNGKEYDFVFDVDIADGMPTLKLAYNLDEDTWTAAQSFINQNNLNPVYLDEVVAFIQARVKESGRQSVAHAMSSYQDPFTGTGRYIPDGTCGSGAASEDPFTGSGRYKPDTTAGNGDISTGDPFTGSGRYKPSEEEADTNLKPNEYFPVNDFILYHDSKPSFIAEKIKLFNDQVNPDLRINIDIDDLCVGLTGGIISQQFITVLLDSLKKWPVDKVYPLLDLLRITIKHDEAIKMIVSSEIFRFISAVQIKKESGPNSYLMLRTLCNMFEHETGKEYLFVMFDEIVDLIKINLENNNIISKNMEITIASLLINYSVLGRGKEMDLIFAMKDLVNIFKNDEARFRLLVAIGTLMINSQVVAISIKGAGFAKFISSCSGDIDSSPKTSFCAKYLIRFV